jgi:glycosyltransferase involved in cell wall biosynthesis
MAPKLSIIIPCYNSEKTLECTLESVINLKYQNWEALIIDDGSTDNTEAIGRAWVKKDERLKYYSKSNEGLGKARNFGIFKAVGEYILPLDSDNLVQQDFACKAMKIFENNVELGVVHGHAEYFGDKTGIWTIDEFKLEKVLISNYIDACAIYKKELWTKVGGYDEKMPYQGHEDWEFWIALGVLNVNFYHLNEVTFKYFVSGKSMINSFNNEMLLLNQDYIMQKYSRLFHTHYSNIFHKNELFYSELIKNKTSRELIDEVLFRIKRKLWIQ